MSDPLRQLGVTFLWLSLLQFGGTNAVVPEMHRQGVGSRLLQAVLDHYPMDTFHHQVLIAERDADGFYRRMGLSAVGAFGLTAFIRTKGK